jgi:hypothetical protein
MTGTKPGRGAFMSGGMTGDIARSLFVTGYSLSDGMKQRINAPVLTKPFREESLTGAVRTALQM